MPIRAKKLVSCLLILAALILSGCNALLPTPGQPESDVVLPTPSPQQAPAAPSGESREEYTERVTMFYVSSDMKQLLPLTRTLLLSGDDDLIEKVMERLLMEPDREDVKAIAPAGTRLLSADMGNGVVTVDLSPEARNQGQQEQVFMRAAITNTLTRLEGAGVRYVNVLIGGQAESMGESVSAMPYGAHQRVDNNLSAVWTQAQADMERFAPGNNQRQLDVSAVLYFASAQDERLLPEVRRVRFTSDDLIMPLLRELVRGPIELSVAKMVLPGDVEPVLSTPTITTSSDGRRLIKLMLSADFEEQIRQRGLSLKQVYGALTLTLCRLVPEVDGLTMYLGGYRVERVASASGDLTFEDGVMVASDFGHMVGETVGIYLADEEGLLTRAWRVLDPYGAALPSTLLKQLILGPRAAEPGLLPVAPEGVSDADFLGVRVEQDTVLINLSSNFYRCCQQLDEQGERLLVYAMVNTLTEMRGISKVRLYVEGEQVDTLVRNIYLRVPLIRNPGISR